MSREQDPRAMDAFGSEPNVIELYTQRIFAVLPPELQAKVAEQQANFCQEYGGQRYFVPKGTKRTLTPEQRRAVFADGMTSMDDEAVIQKHKISRSTLYRVMKGGGGRFG